MAENPCPPSVEDLVAAGDYAAAAARAAEAGDLPRAITLLERIWRFAEAVPLAQRLGDAPLAIRLALDARDPERARQIAESIDAADLDQIERASDILARQGHAEMAAQLLARAGRPVQAAALFQRAGGLLAAGKLLEQAGRFVEAGQLYERAMRDTGPEASQAALAMGTLLGRLGRHHEAARALQIAARDFATQTPALRRLCVELLGLDLPTAAQEIASRVHALDPSQPPSAAEIAALIAALETSSPAATSVDERPAVPQRFRVLRVLGAGSLGRVYAAEDLLLGRTVALKVLSAGAGAEGPERQAFARFLREAEASSRLQHPHIVHVYEARPEEGILVMELLPGGTLGDRIAAEGALSPASVRRLALEVLAGLEAAHSHGIVHRDVKPANILFDGAGNAKLGDFGASHLLDFGQTQTSGLIGTLAYLSPEQITGGPIGAAADIYGLGATLFEALTGQPPFLGPDLTAQHLGETCPSVVQRRPGLSPAHDQVLHRALEKSSDARFASAAAMAEAISGWPIAPVPPPPAGGNSANSAMTQESTPPPHFVGRTPRGRLFAVVDPRVHRLVLREELDQPLLPDAVAQVRALAATGGPHVQRILALDPDLRAITFEAIEGEEICLRDLLPEQQRLLESCWPALAPLGLGPRPERRVLRTPNGPVVLVSPSYQPAKS
jgi:eukaryotic-like serine/threonine-protein kinase